MTTPSLSQLDLPRRRVIAPEDRGWDAARAAWNLLADQRPALVVQPADAGEVAETVRYARAHGLHIVTQGTGHGADPLARLDDALLLRTGRLNGVIVDTRRRVALVGAGARWRDVIAAAAPHGLAALHGFAPGVGVAGYVLGGGLGWLARSHGLGSGSVRSFEVVTADGERRRVDRRQEPDLFWALRGGGGAGAVVTSIELDLVALETAYAGALFWPLDRAHDVVHAYREWIAAVPDTLTSSLRLMHFPPLPQLPDELRGRALVQLTLAFTGTPAEGRDLLMPLRRLAPEIDRVGVIPAAALGAIAGDPEDPMPAATRSRMLATLTPAALDTLLALTGPSVPLLEVRHLGGALRHPSDPGAVGAVDADALVFGSAIPGPAATDDAFATLAKLGPAADRDTLPTFAVPGDVTLTATARERLRAVISAYDPDGALA
jgi:FAD/FMN-containing dehydrogenase